MRRHVRKRSYAPEAHGPGLAHDRPALLACLAWLAYSSYSSPRLQIQSKSTAISRTCQTLCAADCRTARCASQKHPLISHPLRHSLAIEVFQQRNRVLAGDAGEVFERGDVQLRGLALLRHYQLAQPFQRVAMKH